MKGKGYEFSDLDIGWGPQQKEEAALRLIEKRFLPVIVIWGEKSLVRQGEG